MYRTLLACLVGLACAQAQAAEVKVLTTGAMKAPDASMRGPPLTVLEYHAGLDNAALIE